MVRVTINKGFWQNGGAKVTMYHEDCPNPDCTGLPLHYPTYLVAPHCPECRTDLLGAILAEGHGKRIAYHLEK